MTFYKVTISSSSLEGIVSLSETLGVSNINQSSKPIAANSPPPSPGTMGTSDVNSINMQATDDGAPPPLPDFTPQLDESNNENSPPPSPGSLSGPDALEATTAVSDVPPPIPVIQEEVKKTTKKAAPKGKARKKKAS